MPDIFNTVRVGLDMLVPSSTSHARANIILPQAFRLQNIVEMFKANNVQQPNVNGSNGAASSRVNTFNKTAVDSIPNIGPPPIIPMMDSAKLQPPYQGPLRSGDNFIAADKNDLQGKPFVTPIAPDLGKIPGKNMADDNKLPTTFTTPIHGASKGDNVLGGSTGIPESAKPAPFITPMYDGEEFQELYREGYTIKSRMKDAKLPNEGKIRFIPPDNYNASTPLRRGPQNGYIDKFDNEWIKGPSRTAGEPFEWDVQLSKLGKAHFDWASRDGNHLNVSLGGKITHE